MPQQRRPGGPLAAVSLGSHPRLTLGDNGGETGGNAATREGMQAGGAMGRHGVRWAPPRLVSPIARKKCANGAGVGVGGWYKLSGVPAHTAQRGGGIAAGRGQGSRSGAAGCRTRAWCPFNTTHSARTRADETAPGGDTCRPMPAAGRPPHRAAPRQGMQRPGGAMQARARMQKRTRRHAGQHAHAGMRMRDAGEMQARMRGRKGATAGEQCRLRAVQSGVPRPRAATSVAIMIGCFPALNSASTQSRSCWDLSPWMDSAGQPSWRSWRVTLSQPRLVSQKMRMRRPSISCRGRAEDRCRQRKHVSSRTSMRERARQRGSSSGSTSPLHTAWRQVPASTTHLLQDADELGVLLVLRGEVKHLRTQGQGSGRPKRQAVPPQLAAVPSS